MIDREIAPRLRRLFEQYPIVTVTGPRQSGKTTLARESFPNLPYVNLEAPDTREFAESDPRGFLAQLGAGGIIDEIQRVPQLLSYLQVIVDERGEHSLYVLTGSEQFSLSEAISQSLPGRTAILHLLPFSLVEYQRIGGSLDIDDVLFTGFYPRILDRQLEPRQAHADYFETYVERDVRRLGGVSDLSAFARFVRLVAGRVGQLVNLSSLGNDAGVSHVTAKQWLTILERSYIVFQLPPYFANLGKRLIKSPKLYFYDVGLASQLIGIEHAEQLATHPLRGQLFENLVVAEAIKHRFNQGRGANLTFFRDAKGLECDLFYESGNDIAAIEIKAGATITPDYFTALNRIAEQVPRVSAKAVVYGGATTQTRSDADVVPLTHFPGLLKRLDIDHDLETLIDERAPAPPATADVEALESLFRLHIRPTIDALEPRCREIGERLFTSYSTSSSVSAGGGTVRGGSILSVRQWNRTKTDYILRGRFEPSDDRPVVLEHEFQFHSYIGSGSDEFRLRVVLSWILGSDGATRTVSIGDSEVESLRSRLTYEQLERNLPDLNLIVAETLSGVRDVINNHIG